MVGTSVDYTPVSKRRFLRHLASCAMVIISVISCVSATSFRGRIACTSANKFTFTGRWLFAGATERTIASAQARNLAIVFANDAGKLTGGDNQLCVLFQSREAASAANVEDVSVEFRQLVGKMEEKPITAVLSQDGLGRYCGHVNLGPQYYKPSSYYALVRYVDATGRKRRVRLHVSVK